MITLAAGSLLSNRVIGEADNRTLLANLIHWHLGQDGVVVIDERQSMVEVARRTLSFYRDESCGKCTPCREGTFWMERLLHRVYDGHGTMQDVETLESVANQISGRTLCALGEFAVNPVLSTIKHFPEEYRYQEIGA